MELHHAGPVISHSDNLLLETVRIGPTKGSLGRVGSMLCSAEGAGINDGAMQ